MEPIMGVWGFAPSGLQGQAPGQESGSESLLKLIAFSLGTTERETNLPRSC